jgi:hypothetical protein
VFGNSFTRTIGPKKDEVTGGWRKLHKEDECTLRNILLGWSNQGGLDGHVARKGDEKCIKNLVEKPEYKR